MYKFIDLHCDTLTTAFEKGENLFENNLHINLEKLYKYNNPMQVFAIWIGKNRLQNAFSYTNKIIDFFEDELIKNTKYIKKYDIKNIEDSKITAMLSIEGAESLEGDIDNLYHFYKRGIKMLGICWNNENEAGYGVGCNSENGLKPFGKELIKHMNGLNMIIDVSHINESGFWDIHKLSKKPFIASHSNSYSICRHKRNLKDEQIKAIKNVGGVIGINLYPPFLVEKNSANIDDIFRHIEHIEKVANIDTICLGADFDGIDITTRGLEDVSKYNDLFMNIEKRYGKSVREKICYKNFENFLKRCI